MTFFMMKNRFQQQRDEENASASGPVTSRLPRPAGNFLNALFGSASAAPERKPSQTSEASSPSRASSASGRSQAFPPRRISFDEVDYGATRERGGGGGGGQASARSSRPATLRASAADNRPDDHSSGTTDPPDEDPEEGDDFEEDNGPMTSRAAATAASGRYSEEHGSESDSPEEAAPGMDDDLVMFMRQFVEKIFQNSEIIDPEEKNQFGEFARLESGRLWFARFVNSQRINYSNRVEDSIFYRLVQYCAIVLFECYQEEDYGPAKILMNICFTFYKEVPQGANRHIRREFLYHHLRKQAIWHSLKFWNAAYFDAMQADRARRSHRDNFDSHLSQNGSGTGAGAGTDDDYIYRTLLDFITNMRAFHVARESVIEFIRKQSHNLNPDQFASLREQLDIMYA